MPAKTANLTKQSDLTSLANKLQNLDQYHMFLINLGVLGLSIILLALALWTQHHNKRILAPFNGYKVGTTLTMGESAMRLDSVSTTHGSGMFSAPKGMHYIIPTLTIKNTVQKPINVFPSSDIYVKDSLGKVTLMTPYALQQPFRAGELAPGDQVQGQLSYLVPDKTNEKLYIDAIWSGGVVTFDIK